VAALARRYRLHGLAVALLVLAALFVWKQAARFLPPAAEWSLREAAVAEGRDSAAGLANLLRRNIPARLILETCFAEWKKNCAAPKELLARIQALVSLENSRPFHQRRPASAYREIVRLLKERKHT
jgi:hypothetical protein